MAGEVTKGKIKAIENTQKWKLTEQAIQKLEEAFAIDASIEEACFYANISIQTYYNWIKENPDLKERFEALRQKPIIAARQRVVKGLQESYHNAMDYLSKKKRAEFGQTTTLEVNTKVEHTIKAEDKQAVEEFHKMLIENRHKRSLERAAIEGELVE